MISDSVGTHEHVTLLDTGRAIVSTEVESALHGVERNWSGVRPNERNDALLAHQPTPKRCVCSSTRAIAVHKIVLSL